MTLTTLLPNLDPDAVLITINKRLAGDLRARYDHARVAEGTVVWESPDILPWGAWLKQSYTQLIDNGHCRADLLTRSQEIALWETVINRHSASPFLRPGAAAELASDAFARCCAWSVDIDAVAASAGPDTQVFETWRKAFLRTLKQKDFIVAAQLTHRIRQAYEAGQLAVPSCLYLAGFDRFSPDQQALLDGLAARDCRVDAVALPQRTGTCHRVAGNDPEHEIQLAAAWAAAELTKNPSAQLAVVSPTLGALRQPIQRIFTQTLAPGAFLGDAAASLPFNISLGQSLADKALTAHALLGLRLLAGEQPLTLIGQLLRSPFIGGFDSEWEQRALFDAALRKNGRPLLNLDSLVFQLSKATTDSLIACNDLAARLEQLSLLRKTTNRANTPAACAQLLRSGLQVLGWPGTQALSSAEFQQYQRFLELFDELEALGKVRARLALNDAISQLARLAAGTVFQPQTTAKPVQILGILEAAGMSFDAIWLLGMDDRNWPPAPRPNPLLPAALQRELGMPQSSAEHELAFATASMAGLERAAGTCIASHAQVDAAQPLLPSPLIADWPVADPGSLTGGAIDALHRAFDTAGEPQPMPMPNASGAPTAPKGGAALLATQSHCPFAAVARYRLQANPLAEPSYSPDAAMLGSLVHQLLERIWSTLKDSASLARHDAPSLRALITPLAAAALDTAQRHRPDLFTNRFCELEHGRLTNLMLDWLAVERTRRQPFRVMNIERDSSVAVNGLTLQTRADRVDQLPDGSIAVIDYKTGASVTAGGWLEDRLSEPQLPLYATTDDHQVSAALLARVRSDRKGCQLLGVSQAEDFGDAVAALPVSPEGPDWETLLARWETSLDELAAEFLQGRADPTPSPQACGYCALGSLCRVQQRAVQNDND